MGNFEFFSSFLDWESSCLHDKRALDKSPLLSDSWTIRAQLLRLFSSYTDNTYTIAQNGQRADSKKGLPEVGGFPALLPKLGGFAKDSPQKILQDACLRLHTPRPEDMALLPEGTLLLRVNVKLLTPFFSRDDLTFYPTENVLRRDKVFDQPFLSAAGIKGLLHWAACMTEHEGAPALDEELFGTAADMEGSVSRQGLLYCWPLFWKDGAIGLDVINATDRKKGVGTKPVKCEVVEPGANGQLYFLLLQPAWEGAQAAQGARIARFREILQYLMENGGLSAKMTSDWGRVKIEAASFCMVGGGKSEDSSSQGLPEEVWVEVLDENGNLRDLGEKALQRIFGVAKGKKKDLMKKLVELKRLRDSGGSELLRWTNVASLDEAWQKLVDMMNAMEEKTHG